MTRNDRDALKLALAQCRAESPGRAWQIDAKLKDESWEAVAKFAAQCCQSRSLHLLPWEDPPMYGDAPADWCDPDAKKLLQQMLAVGVSRYDPDPMAALQRAKRHRVKV